VLASLALTASSALQALLQVAGPLLDPRHRHSLQDLRLLCKALRNRWRSEWDALHSSWASFGGSRILDHFPFQRGPCFGASFFQCDFKLKSIASRENRGKARRQCSAMALRGTARA
jgi:hypothetical protein